MKAVAVRDNGIVKPLLFGLDDNDKLRVGRRILCNNCSSFSFYSKAGVVAEGIVTHLLVTTKQDPEPERKNEDYLNIWERGAMLVGVIHGDEAAVVFQTPRGKMECIYPRKLVLDSVINALVQRHFKDALLMVR